MKLFGPSAARLAFAGLATVFVIATTAEADPRWRHRYVQPWDEEIVYDDEGDDSTYVLYEQDNDEDVIILNSQDFNRRTKARAAEEEVDTEIWWLEENARRKFEARAKARKAEARKAAPVKKLAAKKKPATPKSANPPKADKIVTASLGKPALKLVPKTKALTPATPALATKVSLPKAPAKVVPKPRSGKTIGCTAGAAVITGYGFADVKPKACTGGAYAYTAARAGKLYHITLTAASGEITDVKKLN